MIVLVVERLSRGNSLPCDWRYVHSRFSATLIRIAGPHPSFARANALETGLRGNIAGEPWSKVFDRPGESLVIEYPTLPDSIPASHYRPKHRDPIPAGLSTIL